MCTVFLLLSLLLLLLLFVFEVVTCFLLINYAVALAGCKSFDNTQLATATGNGNGQLTESAKNRRASLETPT